MGRHTVKLQVSAGCAALLLGCAALQGAATAADVQFEIEEVEIEKGSFEFEYTGTYAMGFPHRGFIVTDPAEGEFVVDDNELARQKLPERLEIVSRSGGGAMSARSAVSIDPKSRSDMFSRIQLQKAE